MSEDSKCLTRGVLAGAIGGLVASWVMNTFMEKAGPTVQHAAEHLGGIAHPAQEAPSSGEEEPKIDATMKTADAVVSAVTGGQHLSLEGQQKAGPIVHYAFGTIMGAVYGAAAEYSDWARAGFGTAFASALFTGADLVAVPALNLGGSSTGAPVSSLATPFSAHVVYGMTTEAVRRLVRSVI